MRSKEEEEVDGIMGGETVVNGGSSGKCSESGGIIEKPVNAPGNSNSH